MKTLNIASDLPIPLQAVTSTFAILAKRGSGKSNVAVAMAEEFYKHGAPFVTIDPKGDWWGIRSSANGKGPGLAIPIFGGLHGDVPLEVTASKLLADLVAEKRLTCVLDTSEFSKKEQTRFLMDFFDRLYRKNREPLHIFLEEAEESAPQRVFDEMARLVYLVSKIVKLGRTRGLGMTAITQRSASLNKDVLTQVETLIVLRTTAPQDRKAILEWVREHEVGEEAIASLPGLQNGEGWIWSPHFLGTMQRVRFRRRETFDSGATPEVGKSTVAPARLADINLDDVRTAMAATIEKAKADDPSLLRQEIAALREKVRMLESTPVATVTEPVPMFQKDELDKLKVAAYAVQNTIGVLQEQYTRVAARTSELANIVTTIERVVSARDGNPNSRHAIAMSGRQAGKTWVEKQFLDKENSPYVSLNMQTPKSTADGANGNVIFGNVIFEKAHRTVLTVLAQHPGGCDRKKLALLAGYTYNGHFRNVLSELRAKGYMEGGNTEIMRITRDGGIALGPFDPVPTSLDERRAFWLNKFEKAHRTILEALFRYPNGLDRSGLCELTGYTYNGHFRNVLSELRTAGVLIGSNTGTMRAAPELLG